MVQGDAIGGRAAGRRGRGLLAAVAVAAALLGPAGTAAAQERITADQAVQIALERSPSVLQAAEEVRAASGQAMVTRSQLLPQISTAGRYNNSIRQSIGFSSSGVRVGTQFWSGRATLDQTLISFPAWGQVRSAEHLQQAAVETDRASRADIALQAYRQYYALLKAVKLADVTAMALSLQQDQLKRTQALFELGSVARNDVLKQQVAVSQAQLDDIAARQNIVVQRALLVSSLGLDPGQQVEIDTTLTEIAVAVDSALTVQQALQARPELAASRARLASARAGLGAAQGLRYPSLTGSLLYGFQTAGLPQTFIDVDRNARWSAAASVALPIFDGFSARGQIREARARMLQAQYSVRQSELNVLVEVQQALQAASQAREQINVARAGREAAVEDLRLTQERYNVGSATVIELIDSQVALTRASADYINAVADAHVAEMQLRRARGERF